MAFINSKYYSICSIQTHIVITTHLLSSTTYYMVSDIDVSSISMRLECLNVNSILYIASLKEISRIYVSY